jgi:hypothetical protein
MNKICPTFSAAAMLSAVACSSHATTFASFIEQGAQPNSFIYSSTTDTLVASVPVEFTYAFAPGDPSLAGTAIKATLTLSESIDPSVVASSVTVTSASFGITAAGNTGALASLNGKDLLSGSTSAPLNGGTLSVPQSSLSGGYSGSEPPDVVLFSSNVINTTGLTSENWALSFVNAFDTDTSTPGFGYSGVFPFQTLDGFNASGTGNFSATSPTFFTPEPGTVAMFVSMGISGLVALRRRRK